MFHGSATKGESRWFGSHQSNSAVTGPQCLREAKRKAKGGKANRRMMHVSHPPLPHPPPPACGARVRGARGRVGWLRGAA